MSQGSKHPLNAEGKFWDDQDTCLACDTCQLEAPKNFEFDGETCSSYVSKQPENEDELIAVRKAVFVCAVEAIIEDQFCNQNMIDTLFHNLDFSLKNMRLDTLKH